MLEEHDEAHACQEEGLCMGPQKCNTESIKIAGEGMRKASHQKKNNRYSVIKCASTDGPVLINYMPSERFSAASPLSLYFRALPQRIASQSQLHTLNLGVAGSNTATV